jgi:putative inorganic carbon (hco3(-)) transporter
MKKDAGIAYRKNSSPVSRPRPGFGRSNQVFIILAVIIGIFIAVTLSMNLKAGFGVLLGIGGLILVCLKPVTGVYGFFLLAFWERVTILPGLTPAAGIGYLALVGFLYNVFVTHKIRIRRTGQEWPFLVFLGIIVISSAYALNRPLLIKRTFTLIQLMIIYYMITSLIDNRERLRTFLWIIFIATLMTSVAALFQYYQSGGIRVTGVGKNPNYTSATLIMGLLVAWDLFKKNRVIIVKYLILLSGGVFMAAFMLTYSRAGLLAMMTGIIYLLFYEKKRGKAVVFGIVGAVVLFIFMPQGFKDRIAGKGEAGLSVEGRTKEIRAALLMIKDHPFFGVGFQNYGEHYAAYVTPYYSHEYRGAHNTFLQLGAELGVPGLLVFLWILFNSWRTLGKARKRSGEEDEGINLTSRVISAVFISYLIICVFAGMVTQKDLWVVLSLGTVLMRVSRNEAGKPPPDRDIAVIESRT